jgi:hypothetical protein
MPRKKTEKKAKSKKPKKAKSKIQTVKVKQKKAKEKNESADEAGIIVIDDDLKTDKTIEHEERRAYLEEARSQEAFD